MIITTYYRNDALERAIEHVINQTYEPIEIIVVDDSGEAFAEPVMNSYNSLRYIAHDQNQGSNQARKTGLDASSGTFVQLHDDDDWLHPEKIEHQMNCFCGRKKIGVVYCGLKHDGGEIILPDHTLRGDVLQSALQLYELYPYQTTTALFRANLLKDVFPLPQYGGGDDYALAIKCAQRSEFDFVEKPLVHRTLSHDSKGSSLDARKAHIEIVHHYSELYAEHPALKRGVLAEAHWRLGHAYLNKFSWTPRATLTFLKAAYYAQSPTPKFLLPILFSLGGRPGRDAGRKIVNLVWN